MKLQQLHESGKYSEIINGVITPATNFSNDSYCLKSTGAKKLAVYAELTTLGNIFNGISAARDVILSSLTALTSIKGLPDNVETLRLEALPNIRSLEGCPSTLRTFSSQRCGLTSLKGLPRTLAGSLYLSHNHELSDLTGMPSEVGYSISITGGATIDLTGIHKKLKSMGSGSKNTSIFKCDSFKGGVLGLLMIEDLGKVDLGSANFEQLNAIINKHLHEDAKVSTDRMLTCQEELIDAGYDEYAKL
jgi:hypothetical protein